MTDGFYPEINNRILRPIRYLIELERLQGNFPYEEDGRHYYLVAYDDDEGVGSTRTTTTMDNKKVIGFCDIDSHECEEHLFIISVYHKRQSTTSLLLGSGRASRPSS